MQKIKIELVHDVVCSWCPIGYSNIKSALRYFEDRLDADIQYLPYELNPDMSAEGEAVDAYITQRNNWTQDQFESYRDGVVAKAKAAGHIYNYCKRTHYYKTEKAHRLIDYAEKFKKHDDTFRALTEQYFTHGVDISKPEKLSEVAALVGLDRNDVLAVVTAKQKSSSLIKKYERVKQLGIKRIPTLVLNEQQMVQGSHSPSYFRQVFADLIKRLEA